MRHIPDGALVFVVLLLTASACGDSASVVAPPEACNAGAERCDGQQRQVCSGSGAWEQRTCEEGTWCQEDGQGGTACVVSAADCTPDCSGKGCGDNGCGGNCGACGLNQTCDETNATCACGWEGDPAAGACCNAGQVWTDGGCCTESCSCAGYECGRTNCGTPCFDVDGTDLSEDGCPIGYWCDDSASESAEGDCDAGVCRPYGGDAARTDGLGTVDGGW